MYQSIHSGQIIDQAVTILKTEEINKTGLRLFSEPKDKHGNIGQNAIDLSYSDILSSIYGATGDNSFAIGLNTTAQNNNSFASGYYTKAVSDYTTVLGKYNIGLSDSILEIGIGTLEVNRKNALNIYKDGTAELPESSIISITARGQKSLITKEYADSIIHVSTFNGLLDTPNNYTGLAGYSLEVNATETGLEFIDQGVVFIPLIEKGAVNGVATLDATGKIPSSQLPPLSTSFTGLTDTPNNYTGSDGKIVQVNETTEELEFVDIDGGSY